MRRATSGLTSAANSSPWRYEGIAAADRESVFDRFVRLEPSRSTPGNGLGLSLVRAVAHRHAGTASLADNRPGLRAILEFPAPAG